MGAKLISFILGLIIITPFLLVGGCGGKLANTGWATVGGSALGRSNAFELSRRQNRPETDR